MSPRQLSLAQAAKQARGADGKQLAQVSLRAAAARGALRARKEGGRWVTSESNLRKYLNGRPRWFKPGR